MAAAPVSLLLLGTGFSRAAHIPALRKLEGEFRVAGVYSRKEENARRAAAELPGNVEVHTDLDSALSMEGIEAVDAALPITPMADAVEAALDRGLHVFSEKPVAADTERARELIEHHAQRPGLLWYVAENIRFWRAAWKIRELIEDGAIGEPLLCQYPNYVPIKGLPFFETEWRRTPDYDGGFLLDGGVHDIAALRVMLGEVAEVAGASMRQADPELPPADTLAATLRFESGLICSYSASYALERPGYTKRKAAKAVLRGQARTVWERFGRRHVLGTRGSLIFQHHKIELVRGLERTIIRTKPADEMVEQFREFHAGVREGRPVRNTPQEALRDLAVVEAILTAAREQRPVAPVPA